MNGTNYQTNYGEGYSQMSLTERLRAESNADKKTDEDKTIPAENGATNSTDHTNRHVSEKESAAPSEDVKNTEPKKSKDRKKKILTPAEEEKFIMKRMAKNNAENAAYEARLITVRKEKSEEDLHNIYKICTDKDIALSDLIGFLKHLKNSDTLKMLIAEISVRSKTVKSEKPSVNKTG